MCSIGIPRVPLWIGMIVVALGVVGACDMPSTGPSFQTETGLKTPVVVEKTFAFLGGPQSRHEPLIDTTTARFDSLFTVSESDQSLSIEEEVSAFNIGSLDQALDAATDGIGVNTSLSETVIQGSGLASQTVSVGQFREQNGVPPPTPPQSSDPIPVARDTIPFPPALLTIPEFEIAAIEADTVRSGTLTQETSHDGRTVNQLTFTLYNDPSNPVPHTDGEGNPPSVKIRNAEGLTIAEQSFGRTIGPGDSEQAVVSIAGKTLSNDSELVLVLDGNDPEDELTVELSPLRYREATLAGVDRAEVTATRTGLSTRGGDGGTQFAGIETREGTLQLALTNNMQFPIEIDSLLLKNNLQEAAALPDTFRALAVNEQTSAIPPGDTRTVTVDLAGRGIASQVDARLRGGLADARSVITAAASDNVAASASGSLTIGALYFWPNGEQVQTHGQADFQQDRIRFDQPGDYVELDGGILSFDNVVSEPRVAFESFTVSFPDLRRSPYGPGDSLSVSFPVGVSGTPSIDDVDLSDLRLSPTGNVVDYTVQGTLERISTQTAETLRVIRYGDAVRADVSVDALDVRAVNAGVQPFAVDVTEDADGNDQLDLADNAEATVASFDGFGGIAENVNGLQLAGSELKFQVTTDAGTNARLYAALQGRGGTTPTFLAGRNAKSVPASAPLGDAFYDGGSQISQQNLIRFGVDGVPPDASLGEPVTRSVTLTDANSTVDDFISALPSSLRFVAQARLTGDDDNRIRLRRPLTFEAGLSVSVPVKVEGTFALEDTIDADFSALDDVTDPTKDVTISSAELRVEYANGIPLGADAHLVVLDGAETEVLTLPGTDEQLRLKPAAKAKDGTARRTRTGTTALTLSTSQVRALAEGRRLRLRLTMDQAAGGEPATIRATDTIALSLQARVEASVTVD